MLRTLGVTIAGISFVILMIKVGTDPDNKQKYIKLTKHVLIATVLITLSLSLVEVPKYYFGSTVEITDGQKTSEMTIGKIEDKDCQIREVVNIDGKWYVVTDIGATLTSISDKTNFLKSEKMPSGIETGVGKYKLENCSILRLFSECQGTFKGYFAEIKYYRDSDGTVFPATSTYSEYLAIKEQKDSFTNTGGDSSGVR